MPTSKSYRYVGQCSTPAGDSLKAVISATSIENAAFEFARWVGDDDGAAITSCTIDGEPMELVDGKWRLAP